ncbi:unnamed protein product [Blepharisma stoltei]|uniref:Uncharacterized protein n=1 Tax=Blepharisma stoltei TaxID=1481888 RepID=A0AAU9K9U4_9CILI|nr:unnamed protein product [Blepharisma stoltei]
MAERLLKDSEKFKDMPLTFQKIQDSGLMSSLYDIISAAHDQLKENQDSQDLFKVIASMLVDEVWISKEKARIASRQSTPREEMAAVQHFPNEETQQMSMPLHSVTSARSHQSMKSSISQQSLRTLGKEELNSEFSYGRGYSFGTDPKSKPITTAIPGPGTYNPKPSNRASSPRVSMGKSARPEHFVKETSPGNLYTPKYHYLSR